MIHCSMGWIHPDVPRLARIIRHLWGPLDATAQPSQPPRSLTSPAICTCVSVCLCSHLCVSVCVCADEESSALSVQQDLLESSSSLWRRALILQPGQMLCVCCLVKDSPGIGVACTFLSLCLSLSPSLFLSL